MAYNVAMKYAIDKQPPLPRVPIGREKTQDEFWLQQGTSGAINAFRQLTTSRQKKGRKKKTSLPGGKLKPLFKNHAAPPRNMFGKAGGRQVLPSIASPDLETASTSQVVMSGCLDNLPPESPSTVRVYLSSNYEDMKAERATLTKYAVPHLQAFCSEHGLYFQLVDLHWGVAGGAHQLQSSSNIRIQEIKACHKLSIGPAFVMLMGDKYGAPRLPPGLSKEEFSALKELVTKNGVEGADYIDQFYKLDKNCVPPQYVIDGGDDEEKLGKLNLIVKKAVDLALDKEKIGKNRHNDFFMSVLEEEIENGIFPLKDPRHQCLLYRREWQDVDPSNNEAPIMVDTTFDENGVQTRDTEKQNKIKNLYQKAHQHLGPSHCKPYYLKWSEAAGRTWAPTTEFQTYLDNLCSDFVADCKHLILQGLKRAGEQKADQLSVYPEVLFQSHLWQSKTAHFHGQEDLIFKVENFLQDPRRNMHPFIIHGPPGAGKSVTMACLAKRIRISSTSKSVVVLRFLGTSAASSSIYNVVVGITTQICLAYGLRVPKLDVHMNTLYRALRAFRNTIESVSLEQASGRPLFILLDGIDQLQPMDESLRALWAISDLPHNVHMIISTVEKVGPLNLLAALQNHISGQDGCHPIAPISQENAKKILNSVLQHNRRMVTSDQEDTILRAFEKDPDPLLLRALADYAVKVPSFAEIEFEDGTDVRKLFFVYLQRLAAVHGEHTIRNIVSFITISGVGIHEKELIDLLTCDQDVMEEVHVIYVVDPDKVATFPPLAWARIKEDLSDLIEEHSAYGKTVIGWKHMVYTKCIGQHFGVIYPGIDQQMITNEGTTLTLGLHESVTNMYLHGNAADHANVVSDWALPDVLANGGVALLSPQPVNVEHVLKLQKLPVHFAVLLPVEGIQRLTRVMFGSLTWLRTKIKAISVQALLHDLAPVISLSKHFVREGVIEDEALVQDLKIIYEFIQLAQGALIKDPDSIVNEVLARLPALAPDHPTVQSLVDQAQSAVQENTQASLVPLYPCLPAPCNPLRYTFEGTTHIIKFFKKRNMALFLCQGSSVDVWKLDTGELVHRYNINPEQSIQGVIPLSNEDLIIIAHYSHLKHVMLFGVWSIDTGIRVVSSTFEQRFETLALDPDDKIIMVSTLMEVNRVSDIWHRCILGVDVTTKAILSSIVVEDIHREGIAQILFARNVNPAVNGLITVGAKLANDFGFWDLESGELVFSLELGCFADTVELISERSLAVCVSSYSGRVVIVDLENGEITQNVGSPDYVDLTSFWVSPPAGHILLATKHHGVAVINLESGEQTKSIGEKIEINMRPSNGKPPTTIPIPTKIVVDANQHYLFVGCLNGSIKIYCIATGEHVDTLHGHTKMVNSLCFDGEGMLYSTAEDRLGRVWFVKDIINNYEKHYTELGGNVEEWDSYRHFDETFDITVSIMEKESEEFPSERQKITSIAMTADEQYVVTSSPRSPVKLWSTEDGRLVRVYKEGCRHGASQVYLAYKDQFVVAHCHNPATTRTKILQIWKRDTGVMMKLLENHIYVFTSCVTPDGSKIFTVGPSEKKASGIVLRLFDLFELKQIASLPCNIYGAMDSTNMYLLGCVTKTGRCPSLSDGSASNINTIPEEPEEDKAQNDINTESEPKVDDEDDKKSQTESDALVAESKIYAVLDYCPNDGVSYFFNFTIGEDKISMERHVPLHMDTKSPQCTVLLQEGIGISGAVDGSLVVWDVVGHEVLANMVDPALVKAVKVGGLRYASSTGQPGHDGAVTFVRLSPSKRLLVTGGVDMKVRVWDVVKKEMLTILTGHTESVLSADISQDGRFLVSGSTDENITLWNVTSGNKMASFSTHKSVSSIIMASKVSRVFALCDKNPSNLVSLKTVNM